MSSFQTSFFILHFSWCFSQLLTVGKNTRTDGVSFFFIKMIELLTCFTFLDVGDLGLCIIHAQVFLPTVEGEIQTLQILA